MVLTVALVLALGLGGTGYAYLVRSHCSGNLNLTVAASPDQELLLTSLAQHWSDSKPTAGGRCLQVSVVGKDSAAVVGALSPLWDQRRDGDRPDVWAPEASTWVRLAGSRANTGAMVAAKNPSLARVPIVVAMPRPMAEAIGWPDRQLGWLDLFHRLKDPKGWQSTGHPEWGRMRIGIADPARDTAALSALLAMVNYDGDNELSADELKAGMEFQRSVSTVAASTLDLRQNLAKADAAGRSLSYLAAFPATEWDVSQYNAAGPRVPLVAQYPPEGAPVADHPYVVLNAPWMDATRRVAAAKFLAYLRGPAGRRAYVDQGFRSPSGAATRLITEQHGLLPAGGEDREVQSSDILQQVVAAWTAMRRRGNVRGIVNTPSSMAQRMPGGPPETKLAIVQKHASYQPGKLNLIFLITDGANNDRLGTPAATLMACWTSFCRHW